MNEIAKKLPKINTPAKASVWYIGTNAVTKAILLISTPIFTRLLSPDEYGVYSLYLGWMGILTVLTTPETGGSAIYRGFSRFADDKPGFSHAILKVQLFMTPAAIAVYSIFRNRIDAILGIGRGFTLLLLLQIFINSVTGIYLTRERCSYKYKKVCAVNLISGIGYPILTLALIPLLKERGEARIFGQFIISLIVAAPIFISLIKVKGSDEGKKIRYVLKSTVYMLPHYLSLSVIAQADKIAIGRLAGADALGKYSVAYSAATVLTLVTAGISGSAIPWLNRKLKNGDHEKVERTLLFGTVLLTEATLLFLALIPEGFGIIAGYGYRDALSAIYPIAMSIPLSFLCSMHTGALLHLDGQSSVTLCTVIGAAFCVILQLLFVRRLGYTSAGAATLTAYVILVLLYSGAYRIKSGKQLVSVNNCLLILLCGCAICAITYLTKALLYPRILIAFLMLFALLYTAKRSRDLIFEK